MSRAVAWAVTLATLCLGLAGHFHGHMLYLSRLNVAPEGVLERSAAPPSLHGGRVVVLVVDGLRWDHAVARPTFGEMAQRGEGRPLVASYPSFTWPGLTTIGTGLPSGVHGVRINNEAFTAPQLDSVSKAAAAAGVPVACHDRGFASFRQLLALPDGTTFLRDDILPDAGLVWVYLEDVDIAGHRHGAASTQYAAAVDRAEVVARALTAQLDLSRDTFVVVSDHGHLDRGGHGGVEPEVLHATFLAVGGQVPAQGVGPARAMTYAAPRIGEFVGVDFRPRWRAPEAPDAAVRAALAGAGLLLLMGCAFFAQRFVGLRPRDFLPACVYGAVFGVGYLLLGYRWTWSIPRGELGFTVETAVVAMVGLGAAVALGQRDRRIPEAWAQMLVFGLPYIGLSVYCGLDTRNPTAPWSTWGLILFATVVFYPGLAFGARALWTALAWDRIRPQTRA